LRRPPPLHTSFERNSILIETLAPHEKETIDAPGRSHVFNQVLRFGLTGGLNTLLDLLILNGLLGFFPTTSTLTLLAYNSLAYSLGAINSFLLNKYWTFASQQKVTRGELSRFTLIMLCGIGWSSAILWLASSLLHPFLVNATVWANASKVVAIAGTALISYLGMRLWVFVSKRPKQPPQFSAPMPAYSHAHGEDRALIPGERRVTTYEREPRQANENNLGPSYTNTQNTPANSRGRFIAPSADLSALLGCPPIPSNSSMTIIAPQIPHSLSVVLPAYNEEQVTGATLEHVLNVLNLQAAWLKDFEVIRPPPLSSPWLQPGGGKRRSLFGEGLVG
jgi:putative flippase GtrA